MNKQSLFIGLLLFVAGFFSHAVYSMQFSTDAVDLTGNVVLETQQQSSDTLLNRFEQIQESFLNADNSREKDSPHNWVKMKDIFVGKDQVRIAIDNPEWAMFTNTNSMDPVIDANANAIQIIPQSTEDIHKGDIVAYRSEYKDGWITHRVIDISEDEQGWYATLKGDNNPRVDPGRIRFDQIERVVVAIIY